VAVHLDDATRAAVAAAASDLRARAGALPVGWVAPENFHVTLKFLGAVDEARVPSIVTRLQTLAAEGSAFAMEIRGLGAFPSATRARVLWAGITEGGDRLGELAAVVDQALARLGFPPETRDFSPHVTMGRVRVPGRSPELATALEAGRDRKLGRVEVRKIALMRSELSPRGARYTPLAALPLGAE
jgi:2'-5' RNA ligase